MFEIVDTNKGNGTIDYIITNGKITIFLYKVDWNGEIYTTGYNANGIERKHWRYKPVYVLSGEDYEIKGFEEV